MYNDSLQNISAEKAILCSIILDNTVMTELGVYNADFYREAHKVIYEAMDNLYYVDRKVIDLITLQQKLNDMNKLEDIGGLAYLLEITHEVPSSAGVKAYADIVRECAMKRELRRYAGETIAMVDSEDCDANKVIDSLQDKLSLLTTANRKHNDMVNIAGDFDKFLAELKEQAANNEAGLPTGFIDLDSATGGLYPSALTVLAARPGMGKTALALNIAKNVVFDQKKSVMFVSLEMKAVELKKRLYSSLSGVELSKIRKPSTLLEDEWKALHGARRFATSGSLNIDDGVNATVADIAHKARQCKHENGLDLLIVDYLQLMASDKKTDNRVQEVSQISRGLKTLARELNIPVIALSQLNRGLESRQNKRPMLSDLRESGSIEQDADNVMFIYRESYYDKESEIRYSELIIAKQRNGPRTTIPLYFDEAVTTFRDLSKTEA